MLNIIELIINNNNALIDAILTILVNLAIIFCIMNKIKPYIGLNIRITANVHATPFPPLNFIVNGNICPKTLPKPVYSI